jgi:predicted Rossmann fold nucleotide-binding protein DprA/Smf involved in DNA uptake
MQTMSLPTQNTQAALLLCAKLGERHDTANALTARQYWALIRWLHERSLKSQDLLTPVGRAQLSELQISEVARDQVERLLDRGAALGLRLEKWIASGIWVISHEDAPYPNRYRPYLQQSAPPVLYGIGESAHLQKGGLAVVGSRRPSQEDLAFAGRIGAACAKQSIAVISGAAKGVDSEAMTAAIHDGGTAVGVLAEGFQRSTLAGPYYDAILGGNLTLVSAYEPDSPWFTFTAMERNKLVYALSDAALVVACSDEQGGTWHGAVEALKRGMRTVYVNASIEISLAKEKLLKSGGEPFPLEPWDDLTHTLSPPVAKAGLFETGRAQGSAMVDAVETEETTPDSSPSSERPPQVIPADEDVQTYSDFVERLIPLLEEPMNGAAISAKLKLSKAQTRNWLKQATEDKKICKTKTPVRYARLSGSLPFPS